MPLNNLQDIINAIQTADQATQIQFAQMVSNADKFLQNQLNTQAEVDRTTNISIATNWWTNTILPLLNNPITSRDDALQNYNDIKNGINTQTDKWKIYILRQKLKEAEVNFIEAKKGNLPITVV